jgi:L-glyceraldehyde 3-phosphate reductase
VTERPGGLLESLAQPQCGLGLRQRGQTLAQMALAWVLRDPRVTSALIGASSVPQLEDNVAALERLDFTDAELEEIDRHATESDINIWAASSGA